MGAITSQRLHAKSSDWPECEACGIRMNPDLPVLTVRADAAPVPVRAIFRCGGDFFCHNCVNKKWHEMRIHRESRSPSPANLFSGGRLVGCPRTESPSQENGVRILEDG